MSATELQALLRFLSQDAKVPLAMAMGKVKELQKANLDTPETIAKVKADQIQTFFSDEKIAKQIVTAAKRVSKKRAAGDDIKPTPKKQKRESLFSDEEVTPQQLEASLELPTSTADEDELMKTELFTNRAPLALAFVLTLLKYSMPEQPLSSRLSLAQGYIAVTSRARAVYLGIEHGKSAEDEGWGEGTASVTITGKEIRILRRWGYEWKDASQADRPNEGDQEGEQDEPAFWALDLESLKKTNDRNAIASSAQSRGTLNSTLPIHRPESARSYILKAFDTPSTDAETEKPKKPSAAAKAAEKERNLGKLLRALDMLYESWAAVLTPEDLDKRTWGWYVKVRPDVAEGAAGWGGKNVLKLADILNLRR